MMKNLLIVFFITVSFTVSAQKEISEGFSKAKITMSSEDPQVQAQLAMVGEMNSVTYFKANKTRSESASPMAGSTTTIIDVDKNEMLLLMDNMMGKSYSKQELDASSDTLENIKVEEAPETKTFLGYECKKYLVTMEQNGVSATSEYYVTDKISAATKQISELGDKVKGYPLYMVVNMNQMGAEIKLTYEVTEVKAESVSDDKFDMTIPEGYSEMNKN